jgi:multiple sugar transport system ATP-binding protein
LLYCLELKQGQGFDLGIRPEDIRVIEPQRRRERREEEEGELVGLVKVVEPLGREILIRVGLAGVDVQVNMQVGSSWMGNVGDRISIQFDLDRLFVFDPSTGNTVYPVGLK